jgi:hypothetical protein
VEKTRWMGRLVVGEFRFVSSVIIGTLFFLLEDEASLIGWGRRDESLDVSPSSSLLLGFLRNAKYRIARQVHQVPIIRGMEGSPLESDLDPLFALRFSSADDAPRFAVLFGFDCLRRLMLLDKGRGSEKKGEGEKGVEREDLEKFT